MSVLFLHWSETGQKNVSTVEELDRLLDGLGQEARTMQPLIVFAVNSDGDSLSIGLGRSSTVLSFTPRPGRESNLASVGDINAPGTIVFYTYGHLSEFPRWQCIPLRMGRDAMRDFFEKGVLSDQVAWREI